MKSKLIASLSQIRQNLGLFFILCAPMGALAEIPDGYYNTCEGLSSEALLVALNNRISDHTTLSYNALWTAYKTTDADEEGRLYDIYSTKRWEAGAEQCGTGKACVGSCYTREHSFPKSWFGGMVYPMYTDAFHIYPADFYVNNQRSNNPYGECANGVQLADCDGYSALGKLGASTFPGYTGKVFEPVDEYKGDLARGYFYMAACYYNEISGWECPMLAHTNFPAFSDWALELLLKWHRQDPVSDKELARQEAVYKVQSNRNPFIDHPELVEYIWGNRAETPWSVTLQAVPVFNAPVNASTIDCGTVKVGETATTTIFVNGTNFTSDITLTVDNRPNDEDSSLAVAPDEEIEDFHSITNFVWTAPENLSPAVTDFTENDSKTSYSVTDKLFFNGNVSISFAKGTASQGPRLYRSNDVVTLRFYGTNSCTIATTKGNIKKIEIGTPAKALYHAITPSTGEISDDCLVWTGDDPNVTFTWAQYATTDTGNANNNPIISYFTVYTEDDIIYSTKTLTVASFDGIATSYKTVTAQGTNGRVYEANAQTNGLHAYIQMRNSNNSGLVTTAANDGSGSIRAIRIKWNPNTITTSARKINVYGKTTPYTSTSDLYSESTRGTLLGTLVYDPNNLETSLGGFSGYRYIGLHPTGGALYLDEIELTWDEREKASHTLGAWLSDAPTSVTELKRPATVLYQSGKYLYINDGSATVLVYGDLGRSYNVGDIIPAGYAGSYATYNGVPELIPDPDTFADATSQAELTPRSLMLEPSELTADRVNQFICLDEVTIAASTPANNYIATTPDGSSFLIYNRFLDSVPLASDAMVTGFVSLYNGQVQIIPTVIREVEQREFTLATRIIDAETFNASTNVDIDFTPSGEGRFYATLIFKSGDLSNVVYLTGEGVNTLTALEAVNVDSDAFTARWVDIDEGGATYQLYVTDAADNIVAGYPVAVASDLGEYRVEDLDGDTAYKYYLVRKGTDRSNVVEVTTLPKPSEIHVNVAGASDEYGGVVNTLRLASNTGNYSTVATISILALNVEDDLELSIDAPFEISENMEDWGQSLTLDNTIDHVYLRLSGCGCAPGNYLSTLEVKAGFVPYDASMGVAAIADDEPTLFDLNRNGYWSIINDDLMVHGEVTDIALGVESNVVETPWEAWGADNAIVVDNRTAATISVEIFTLEGYYLGSANVGHSNARLPMTEGYYLVVSGNDCRRVVVK